MENFNEEQQHHMKESSTGDAVPQRQINSPQQSTPKQSKHARGRLDQLLVHALSCPGCHHQPCQQMKSHWQKKCPLKISGDCRICKRLKSLWRSHSKHCKPEKHNVSKCPMAQIQLKLLKVQLEEHDLFRNRLQLQFDQQKAEMRKRLQDRFKIKY